MSKITKLSIFASFVLVGGSLTYGVLAQIPAGPTEAEIGESRITFPVAELGNCANKSECHSYCERPENISACVSFAKKYGLMNEEEAARAIRLSGRVLSGETPGACRTPRECENYCEDITHIEECLTFAEENDLGDIELGEARKIRDHLRSGGELPGGCASKRACETYCEDFEHIEECINFARQAGLDSPGGEELPSPQMIELIKRGETPGGCRGREQCEKYCGDSAHIEECITFGEKAGFISAEEAEMARRTGGRGPGDCNSRESCDAYCNTPENQEQCFQFAKDHGFLKDEDLNRIKEGSAQLKSGLEHANAEVKSCLQAKLGPNIIEDIQADRLTPGPQIGERVRECFEKFGGFPRPDEIFRDMPPKVMECVRGKIDMDGILSGQVNLGPEMGDVIRTCFQAVGFGSGEPGGPAGSPGGPGGTPPNLGEIIRSAPPEVVRCLESSVGDLEKLKSGEFEGLTPDIGNTIRGCFEGFSGGPSHGGPGDSSGPPEEGFQGSPGGEFRGEVRDFGPPSDGGFAPGGFGPTPEQILGQFPGRVAECIKQNLNESDLTNPDRIRAAAERCFTESGTFPGGAPSGGTSPSGEFGPPPGSEYPTGGQYPSGFTPSPDGEYPTGGSYPPPEGSYSPPPGGEGALYRPSLLGTLLTPYLELLLR